MRQRHNNVSTCHFLNHQSADSCASSTDAGLMHYARSHSMKVAIRSRGSMFSLRIWTNLARMECQMMSVMEEAILWCTGCPGAVSGLRQPWCSLIDSISQTWHDRNGKTEDKIKVTSTYSTLDSYSTAWSPYKVHTKVILPATRLLPTPVLKCRSAPSLDTYIHQPMTNIGWNNNVKHTGRGCFSSQTSMILTEPTGIMVKK